jgi:hypothetical protein
MKFLVMLANYCKNACGPAYASNWALVVVGAIAGFLAWLTLRKIGTQAGLMKDQADQMRSQTEILTASVRVAKESADIALRNIDLLISKERARLLVEVALLNTVAANEVNSDPVVRFTIHYVGTTEAFVDYAEAEAKVCDSAEPASEVFPNSLPLPKIISKQASFGWIKIPVQGWSDKVFFEVEAKTKFVHFYGNITYKDVFGQEHKTGFYYVWQVGDPYGVAGWKKKKCKGYDQDT